MSWAFNAKLRHVPSMAVNDDPLTSCHDSHFIINEEEITGGYYGRLEHSHPMDFRPRKKGRTDTPVIRTRPKSQYWKAQAQAQEMIVDLDTKVIQGTPYWEDIYKFTENTTSIPIPEEHEEDNIELNVTFNSASFKCSYLMSNSLNDKWLAWTVETPQKSPFMIKRW